MTYETKRAYGIFQEDGSLAPDYREVFSEVGLRKHPDLWQITADRKTTRRFNKKGIDENVINDLADWLLRKFKE